MPERWSLRGAYRQQQSASRKLQTLVAHAEGVTCVKIGPRSGQILASGGEDGKLNLWRVGRTACLQSIQVAKRAVQCVAFDADENVAAVGSRSGSVKLLALNAGGKTRCRLTGHRAECTSTAFHPLGNVLGSGGQDTDVRVWDIRTRGCVRTFADHEDSVSCLAFSPDGKWVASGSEDRTVKLWDLQAGKLLHEFAGHRGGISAVRFHPDEFWLATGSKDGTVRYWDLETFRQVGATPTEHGQAIRQIAFLDTASQADEAAPHNLVCASDNGLRVWSLQPTRGISAEPIAWGSVQDAQITRDKNGDQRMIACALKDRTMVTVWSVDMNALVQDETDDHGEDADADDACNVEEFINDDIIVHVTEEVMKEHAKFRTVMQERLDELERILSIWRDNEPTRALESLEAVGNPSVTYDFFRCVNFRNGQSATLDICAAALPVLVSLGESKYEVHIKSLLATGKFLFDSFAPMISATLDHHRRSRRQSTRSNVDISREERVHK
ncbi:Katanin p80 WD40 repeat-containing subunit B1 [Hondaea fermentalgiana]|uniref:Katanin p80 WD40 repeat-containing subunit B1 n=1 Tax=Hondaea fermentalgiana TaxID=2315210 RepID=A0A2R5G738_9STRA|nr:Katanin p80 WD40 repeat-containing subunit B1 [Hondaea fermentalgiana]|eukprot:GBG26810.1 Katanin p80 WD40 repeat-containing subunit B1 [Hondaea fermentalgiana]